MKKKSKISKIPGRGRPRKDVVLEKRLNLRLSENEIEELKAVARSIGIPLSTYVRRRLRLTATRYGDGE